MNRDYDHGVVLLMLGGFGLLLLAAANVITGRGADPVLAGSFTTLCLVGAGFTVQGLRRNGKGSNDA